MFTAALFIITPNCKQPKCPSAGRWINNVWYSHLMFIKKDPFDDVATCMHSKNIMLNEKNLQ